MRSNAVRPFYQDDHVTIYHGDCREIVPTLGSRFDMVLVDPPYGTTHLKWDRIIPFDVMWGFLAARIKPTTPMLFFGSEPFSTGLRSSNLGMFRYDWVWLKTNPTGFLNAKKMPLKNHELISVFYQKLPKYHPVMRRVDKGGIGRIRRNSASKRRGEQQWRGISPATACKYAYVEKGLRYPTSVIECSNFNGALFGNVKNATLHPTQKPLALCEYLIATYTDAGDSVLDFTAGSGSTGRATFASEEDKSRPGPRPRHTDRADAAVRTVYKGDAGVEKG